LVSMLIELRIRDYAVIHDLSLRLEPGLNVFSGETGAGKSIIVGALSLLLGERASSQVVRKGADRAVVEAAFDVAGMEDLETRLAELGFPAEDGVVVLRREVAAEGRNRAWVNGSPATASVLGEVGGRLVDIHGQHEHQSLLRVPEQRWILDVFGEAEGLARETRSLNHELALKRRELEEKGARIRELETRADFLRFQLGEIDAAALQVGEEDLPMRKPGALSTPRSCPLAPGSSTRGSIPETTPFPTGCLPSRASWSGWCGWTPPWKPP
jgi:DNA repair protein RecN (Recombination protein N)